MRDFQLLIVDCGVNELEITNPKSAISFNRKNGMNKQQRRQSAPAMISLFLIMAGCESALKGFDEKEIYHHKPEVTTHGLSSSNDLEVMETDGHVLQIRARSDESRIASTMDVNSGRAVPLPDELNSRNIKVVVNNKLGYTTFAGLRFRHDASVNVWEDGTVEVDRKDVEAEDRMLIKYVSRKVRLKGKTVFVMMRNLEN